MKSRPLHLDRQFARTLAVAGLGLVLAATLALGSVHMRGLEQAARTHLETTSALLVEDLAEALARGDSLSVEARLGALRAVPGIRAARVITASGVVIASYWAGLAPAGFDGPAPVATSGGRSMEPRMSDEPKDGFVLDPWSGMATLVSSIPGLGGGLEASAGTLEIRARAVGYSDVMSAYAWPVWLLMFGTIAAAFLLARRLAATPTRHLRRLREIMETAARDGDYTPCAPASGHGSGDENDFGTALNTLLARAQAEKRALLARQHRLEQASRAKSEFLANMSHELRTPLNAVIGFAEVLKSELLGPLGVDRYRTYANDIFDSGRHLLSVINDILDLSRIEAGEFRLSEQETDLAELIEKSVRLVRVRAEAAHLTIAVRIDPPPPRLRLDPRLVKQALINLLSNAVKFSLAHGRIEVRVERDSHGAVTVAIQDEGIGISARDIDRILRPFEQTEAGRAHGRDGTGLGLPLTKSFIEAHGGTLILDSAPGVGTTVTLRLPAERVVDGANRPLPAPLHAATAS